jgi:hypothetical protein
MSSEGQTSKQAQAMLDARPGMLSGSTLLSTAHTLNYDPMYPGMYSLMFSLTENGVTTEYSYTVIAYYMDDLLYVELVDDFVPCEIDCDIHPTTTQVFDALEQFLQDFAGTTLSDEDLQMEFGYTIPEALLLDRVNFQDATAVVTIFPVAESGMNNGWYTIEFDLTHNGMTDSYFYNVFAYVLEGTVYFQFEVDTMGGGEGGGFTDAYTTELTTLATEFLTDLHDDNLSDEAFNARYNNTIPQDMLDLRANVLAGTTTINLYVVMTVDVEQGLYQLQFDVNDTVAGFYPFDFDVMVIVDNGMVSFEFLPVVPF